jgi:hypothetical protein
MDLKCKETILVSYNSLFNLKAIECANLEDQNLLNEKDYPNLFSFWNNIKLEEYENENNESINEEELIGYENLKNKIYNEIYENNENKDKNENIENDIFIEKKINFEFFNEEQERKIYKIFEKDEYEENKEEIFNMISELRKIGYIYIGLLNFKS